MLNKTLKYSMRSKKIIFKSVIFLLALLPILTQAQTQKKPNILVIWGDDIGTWNISHNNRGMMGYRTPNIDRIADACLRESAATCLPFLLMESV